MKYVSVDDLQAYCDNQIDHSITPNDFQRMNHLDIVRCKDCIHYRYYGLDSYTVSECKIDHTENPDENWFCADGELESKNFAI